MMMQRRPHYRSEDFVLLFTGKPLKARDPAIADSSGYMLAIKRTTTMRICVVSILIKLRAHITSFLLIVCTYCSETL
jgi:hypothetical protein